MCRDEYGVLVVVEIPGLTSQEELSLTLNGLHLEIEGHLVRHYIKAEEQLLLSERINGRFKRTIELPPDCALEAIQADYQNGLLYVRLPLDPARTSQTKDKVRIQFHT
jgi:HSP20 family protein